jgi:hypothetical protein
VSTGSLSENRFEELEELSSAINEILNEMSLAIIDRVFEDWVYRSGKCRRREGESIERIPSFDESFISFDGSHDGRVEK